jgi:hypothetical protein
MMIELTDWETGKPVFLKPEKMDVIRTLPPISYPALDGVGEPTEVGERTRIQIGDDCLLVRETPEEIMQGFPNLFWKK